MDFYEFTRKFQAVEVINYPSQAGKAPVVSVCVHTYQHSPFIRECLDSILQQQTKFDIEVLVGEDNSSDSTREICIEYAQKYPDKIRLFLHHRENNIHLNGHPSGRFNFVYNLFSARGKYIAVCEGDDYWTDPHKLQKQVDFLEANLDCIVCHHWQEIAERDEHGLFRIKPAPEAGHGYYPLPKASVKEIFANKLRVKTRTLMFRNINLKFPDWFFTVAFGDVPLSMLLGKYGLFGFINETMAVYRLTGNGASTVGSKDKMFIVNHYLSWIKIWEYGNAHYDHQYTDQTLATVRYFYDLILIRYKGSLKIAKRLILQVLQNKSNSMVVNGGLLFHIFKKFILINIKKRWKK